ncbi:MAG: phenylalanine--tRNA ligase subunit alpha [Candidatus Omnitrophica bacterium]|nr:phenylalanine--tRNA ligase subunit alpha [Candidatus Omnitrophota bacterium]
MPGYDSKPIREEIERAAQGINSSRELEEFKIKYLGRKGVLAQLTASIPQLAPSERAAFGKEINALKEKIALLVAEKQGSFAGSVSVSSKTPVDVTMPGIAQPVGRIHVLTQLIEEICDIFVRMGFLVMEGPEVESEYNNFTGLNIPLEHPSREAFDTFYLKRAPQDKERFLLRSQTSPVQVRAMKAYKPPLAVVAPGRVYRPDAVDASHSFMFHQIEGFMVDRGITFADLKGTLELFAKTVFGKDISMRFRPHFFPFTEPSAEVDISCIICKGKGCSVCGRKGWLEILGSGMIHPQVFRNVGYDPSRYTGFAFGMGVERIAMLRYGINDIRLFFENDARFLKEF